LLVALQGAKRFGSPDRDERNLKFVSDPTQYVQNPTLLIACAG